MSIGSMIMVGDKFPIRKGAVMNFAISLFVLFGAAVGFFFGAAHGCALGIIIAIVCVAVAEVVGRTLL